MGCLYTGCGVSKWDGVLVYGIGCSYTGCGVSIQDAVLKKRTGCYIIQGEMLVYRMWC